MKQTTSRDQVIPFGYVTLEDGTILQQGAFLPAASVIVALDVNPGEALPALAKALGVSLRERAAKDGE